MEERLLKWGRMDDPMAFSDIRSKVAWFTGTTDSFYIQLFPVSYVKEILIDLKQIEDVHDCKIAYRSSWSNRPPHQTGQLCLVKPGIILEHCKVLNTMVIKLN
jgi:hypothetical protein